MLLGNCDGIPELGLKLVAVVVILTVVFVNCASVKLSTRVVTLFGVGKVLSLIVIVIGGIVRLLQGTFAIFFMKYVNCKHCHRKKSRR